MRLNQLRLGMRLGLGFGSIFVILVVMILTGNILTRNNKQHLVEGLTLEQQKATLVTTMRNAVYESGIAMRNIGLFDDVAAMQKEDARVKAADDRFKEARDKLTGLGLTEEEQKIVAEITRLSLEVSGPAKEAIGQALAFDSAGATKIISTKINPLNQQAVAEMDKLAKLHQASIERVLNQSITSDSRLMVLLFALGGIALVTGGVLAWVITRSITLPLNRAVDVANRVAVGDLTGHIENNGADEIGQLFDALRKMNNNLADIVGNVRTSTESIRSASDEIATGNSDLSARTESQASSLEETAASMEELTATVKQNADNARQANTLAASASELATRGGNVVNQVVETMGSIKGSSRKIVDIISVIDGIAFQTNILALNAAVEAARAGEQGRGFAVVASEVRTLAQRSAAAAKEIKALIQDSVGTVATGEQLVGEAGATMTELVTSVKQVADIMSNIMHATSEQASGIEQVNQTVVHMDETTQQNAALVEESAAAAIALRDETAKLVRLVATFTLANGVAPTVATKPAAPPRVEVKLVPAETKPMATSRPQPKPSTPKLAAAKGKPVTKPDGEDDWEEF